MARLALRTELPLPLRLQDTAESDLDVVVGPLVTLLDVGLPITVPPLMTVVRLGVADRTGKSTSSSSLGLRLGGLGLSARDVDSSFPRRPSLDLSCSTWLPRLLLLIVGKRRS
jgi:hypothetical protein